MKTELILKSDVLDILFDNRNKAYGAYNLRKFYDNRLMKSLVIMMGVVVVLSAFTFIPKKAAEEISVTPDIILGEIPNAKEPVKKKEVVKLIVKPAVLNQKKFLSDPLIVPDKSKADTFSAIKPGDVIGSTNITAPDGGDNSAIIQPAGSGEGGPFVTPEPAKPAIDINTPIYSPEIMPSYPGGIEALRKFLQKNLTNPKEMEEGEEVSVKVQFIVDYNGNLKSFVTVQDGGEEFNKEVIRVLNKMPNWIPGKSNGQNVSVYYTIPVKFIAEH